MNGHGRPSRCDLSECKGLDIDPREERMGGYTKVNLKEIEAGGTGEVEARFARKHLDSDHLGRLKDDQPEAGAVPLPGGTSSSLVGLSKGVDCASFALAAFSSGVLLPKR